jgi:hypothetical protein
MKTIAIEAGDGVLRLPQEVHLSPGARLAVLVLEEEEADAEIRTLADAGGAFDFLIKALLQTNPKHMEGYGRSRR